MVTGGRRVKFQPLRGGDHAHIQHTVPPALTALPCVGQYCLYMEEICTSLLEAQMEGFSLILYI